MTHRAPRPAARSARLAHSDLLARIRPDGYSEHGFALDVGGIEQSHVDLEDPTVIRHEYLRRIAHVVDTGAATGTPVRVLHLGAGALTLARYVQATRPGSPQVVVEIENDGMGVDVAVIGDLFEPGVSTRADGTGLGLALARRLARRAGGDLRLASMDPVVFELRLPPA